MPWLDAIDSVMTKPVKLSSLVRPFSSKRIKFVDGACSTDVNRIFIVSVDGMEYIVNTTGGIVRHLTPDTFMLRHPPKWHVTPRGVEEE